jgi:hypothetical protein
MHKGDTFLMGNPGGRKKHLWIVIGDVPHPTGRGVAVNTSTDLSRTKGEWPLTIGDHPWITENCAIAFGDALELNSCNEDHIKAGIGAGFIIIQPPVTPELVLRIQTVAIGTLSFPRTFLKYF